MPPERPFAELMQRLKDGDADAAREVFDRYARRLVGLAAARLPEMLRPKVDAEDVVQSVFRSFFARQAAGKFEVANWDALWAILTVLTVRKCGHRLEYFRAARRDVRREAPAPARPDDSTPGREPPDPEPTPAEAILLAETLEQAVAGLKESHRSVVLLRLQGCTIEEVSTQLGCSERTVHRVLDQVRQRLGGPVGAGG
jgi:RNA polymerase sigma-70 factor (ECF subfamily)